MIKRKYILLLVLFAMLFSISLDLYSQGQIETMRDPDNYNENTFGLKVSSNGIGFDYRFSERINYRLRRSFEIDYNTIKSPKEIKVVNPYFDVYSLRRFVFGKTYFVNNLNISYGLNRMIFEKRDKNSISIHLHGSLGVSLAISKPIYYEIVDSIKVINDQLVGYTSFRQVDVHMQNNPTDIVSRAPFKYGLNELKLHPGINVRAGVAFDFSNEHLRTSLLETGLAYNYYIVPFEVMAGKKHPFLFSIYISYRFGIKYDANINREARRWEKKQQRLN